MKKKIMALAMTLLMTGTMFAGCKSTTPSTTAAAGSTAAGATDNQKATDKSVGMSTDEGGKGDKSFNDAAIAGLDKMKKEFGLDYKLIETKDPNQIQQNLETIASSNEMAVTVGFKMEKAVAAVSKANPDKKFLLIDAVVENPNVKNVLFKEHEGSFLMGVVAGMMTKTNKVGFIGGVEGDVIGRFESGFAAGVAAVNPEAGKLLVPGGTEKHGKFVTYAGNFSDTNKGKEIANDMYGRGADIIYHAAGGVGIGLFDAAQEQKKFAMGVDSDQALILPDKADVILVSMLKRVDVAVFDTMKDYIEGNFKSGMENLGLKENAVSLSDTLHPDLKARQDVLDKVEEYKKQIVDGKLVVPGTVEELKKFKAQ